MNAQNQIKQLLVSEKHHGALGRYCDQPHIRRSLKGQTEMLIEAFLASENFPITEPIPDTVEE